MDWGSGASGAAEGALTGASFGPYGALAGGLIGGAMGLFSQPQKQQEYHDPFQVTMNSEINRLLSSNLGAEQGQMEAATAQRGATEAYQGYASNPDFAKNANLMAGAYNKLQESAQRRGVQAQLAGAQIDQRSRAQGLQLQNEAANRAFEVGRYNNQIDLANNQPGFFEQGLMNTLSQGAGMGLGKLLGGTAGSTGNGYTKPLGGGLQPPSLPSNMDLINRGLGLRPPGFDPLDLSPASGG